MQASPQGKGASRRPLSERRFIVPLPSHEIEPGPVPSFSVVIPAYQAAETLPEAIESALSQTVSPHEVVVCDDGSTDDVTAAVAPYRDRIVLLRKPHGGVASAKNAATRRAGGEFLAFLDADDRFLPDRLEALGELAARRPDLDILSTDAHLMLDGVVTGRFYERTPFALDDQRAGILQTCFVGLTPAVRRRRLLSTGGFDESFRWGEDWEAWIRVILDGGVAGLVDQPLLCYRLHAASATAQRVHALAGRVRALEKHEGNAALTAGERRCLDTALARARRRAALAEAEAAATDVASRRRRRLLGMLARPGYPPRARLIACGGLLAPRLTRRRLERRLAAGRSPLAGPLDRTRGAA
jgi:Glycosyl transferase family 2